MNMSFPLDLFQYNLSKAQQMLYSRGILPWNCTLLIKKLVFSLRAHVIFSLCLNYTPGRSKEKNMFIPDSEQANNPAMNKEHITAKYKTV